MYLDFRDISVLVSIERFFLDKVYGFEYRAFGRYDLDD